MSEKKENNVRTSNIIMGIGLIIFGFLFLFDSWFYYRFNFGDFWPIVIILIGVSFLLSFWRKRSNYGVLMPGTILAVYGLMFLFSTVYGWNNMERLWPGFLFAPGLGFLLMYFFGKREKGLLVPALIMLLLAFIFWGGFMFLFRLWPLILVGFGAYLIFRGYVKQKQQTHE
jgi:hypothetical protein